MIASQSSPVADELLLTDEDKTTGVLVIGGRVRGPAFVVPRGMDIPVTDLVSYFRSFFEHRREHGDLAMFARGSYDKMSDAEFEQHVVATQEIVTAAHAVADSVAEPLDSEWLQAAAHGQLVNYAIAREQLGQLFPSPGEAGVRLQDGLDQHGWSDFPKAVAAAVASGSDDSMVLPSLPIPNLGARWINDRGSADRREGILSNLAPWWEQHKGAPHLASPVVSGVSSSAPIALRLAINDGAKFITTFARDVATRFPGQALTDVIGNDQQWRWLAQLGTRMFPKVFMAANANVLPLAAFNSAVQALNGERGVAAKLDRDAVFSFPQTGKGNDAPLPTPRGVADSRRVVR